MKAVFCEKLGTPDDLVVREIDPPGAPGPGQIKVWINARGVAFTDVLMAAGEYQVKPELPFVIGGEGAGVVTEVGPEVEDFSIGDRVLCSGGCVEQVLVDVDRVTRLPDTVGFEAAGAFRANYATGLYGLQRARLEKGETLLVHGAAGGVGLAAVDLGKHLGASVIATASTEEKRQVALEMGADHAIDYTSGFREEVKELHRAVRSHTHRRFHQRPAGTGEDQPPPDQGCGADRLHHWRPFPARSGVGGQKRGSIAGLARRGQNPPVYLTHAAARTDRRSAESDQGPEGDRQGSTDFLLGARGDIESPEALHQREKND
jgi:hypothetical protein